MIPYKIKDKINAPDLARIRLKGPIAGQMECFLSNRVYSDYAKDVIYQETEDAFRRQEDDLTPVGMWRGEYWGKWMISACRVCRYESDSGLKAFIHEAALRLLSLSRDDGYIGTYRNSANVLPADPEKTFPIMGYKCEWNWNIWCRKYTLWGLLESYLLTKDEKILNGAEKFARQLIEELAALGIRLCRTGTFRGAASGSILKPMLILYQLTEDKLFLDFCIDAASDWDRPDGSAPNLIANSLSGTPIHEWYPHSEKWAKAYETMSCLDGLLELYRITGTQRYFDAVKAIFVLLRDYEFNELFSVGFNDIFANASELINTATEPCDVIHWMRLCYELYKLTGEPEYMDFFELAFLNPLQAGTFYDGKWGARAVRSAGRHMVAVGQSGMKYSHCCVNNLPRAWMNACEAAVMAGNGGIYVNLFTEYECCIGKKGRESKVTAEGTYLRDGAVNLTIETKHPEVIFIRIPRWSKNTKLWINGQCQMPERGTYWSSGIPEGRTRLLILFDMTPVIREFKKKPERYPSDDFRVKRFVSGMGNDIPESIMTWEPNCTVQYGPLLLTRSKLAGNTEEEMFHTEAPGLKDCRCTVTPISLASVREAFRVCFENGEHRFETVMCDFATGTNHWSEDDPRLFQIYLQEETLLSVIPEYLLAPLHRKALTRAAQIPSGRPHS